MEAILTSEVMLDLAEGMESMVFDFFHNSGVVPNISEKQILFRVFHIFLYPIYVFLGFSTFPSPKKRNAENPKNTYMSYKKKTKNEKKNLFFRNSQNYLRIIKKVKKSKIGPILLDLQPIFGRFLRWPK